MMGMVCFGFGCINYDQNTSPKGTKEQNYYSTVIKGSHHGSHVDANPLLRVVGLYLPTHHSRIGWLLAELGLSQDILIQALMELTKVFKRV